MEVVGAVASFIAIGQALSTARHVAHIARAIPGVEALGLIEAELAKAGVIASDSKFETLYLEKAMLQLTESTRSLEEIRNRCTRPLSADGKDKIKKRAWFWLQAELADCRSKARDARENLQLALQSINAQSITLSMQIVSNVQQLESSTGIADAPESPPSKDEKPSYCDENSSCCDEDLEALQDDKPLQVVAVRQPQQALPNPQASAPTDLITPQASSIVNQVSGLLQDRCPVPCCCRCHVSKPVSYTPTRWARNLVGNLNVNFNRQLGFHNSAKCTEASCKNKSGASMTVAYQFPVWLCSRAVQLQTLVGATTGLRVSLRPARILPFGSNFWAATDSEYALSSRETVQQWMLHYGNVFPGDTNPDGMTVLESVIGQGSTDVLLYLFQIWEDQITNGNYDDSWFYKTHHEIANTPDLPEQKMQILTRILSAGKWTVNASQTPLHDALCRGDFEAAFRAAEEFSWAINQRNYEGNTPLHIAATQGHLDSVKRLVHLGCDINEANWKGRTALMLASKGGHILTVQYLIDAGSWVNATDRGGDTAIMIASIAGPNNLATILQALIRAGASVTITDKQGDSAIHHLTSSCNKSRVIRESLRVLLEAGSDIESRQCCGRTPLLLSVQSGDRRGTQCLIEAGAKITCVTYDGWGLLHEAALYGTNKLLRYLATLDSTAINTSLLSNDGETPWDLWIFTMHVQGWQRADVLRPTPKRQEAFISMIKSIRDRNLTVDLQRLDWLLQYLRDRDQRGAIAALSPLIKQKEDWKRWEILGTYKAIGLQIREEMWEAAVESVEEVIDCLRERMATSPCDSESYYDPETHTIYRARELV
ncbi:pfs domain-containing protein [Colletotrichum tamarilloi]|uniref:Pfs domain-containing protein n=1 Tax=Colletotrichum tamarilloi TaxID=1209934 RepID=A0ABQ9QWT2_9PEZI|nr:pfs domain-containing protein [Colletotrichum tamarilloi]KAK1487582.1 pfs domain-containing protein [Colletotrichum tamarilloi]